MKKELHPDYYEATVTDHKGVVHPYYCLHILPNDYSMIDFDKTIFKKTTEPMKIWPELAFPNMEEIFRDLLIMQ